MRVLLVSDLHYRLRQFDWLLSVAKDPGWAVDVIAISGDLLDIRSAVPLEVQSIAVSAALRVLGEQVTVLVASGNHDLDGRDSQGEKAAGWLSRARSVGVHVDSDSVLLDDTLFTVCPWWDGPLGRAALAARLALDAARPKQLWVWVYHSPPTDSPLSWDGRREYGDPALAGWLADFAPDLVLTGHIHQAPFVAGGAWNQRIGKTWLFNAGQQPGPMPTHVMLDLDGHEAVWTSATGQVQIALDGPARDSETAMAR